MIADEHFMKKNSISVNEKVQFMFSLFKTLVKLKDDENIDDVYLYEGEDKIEIYVFNKVENFDTEDFITETIVQWEQEQCYFPEVFINTPENKMNILPRKSFRIC